MSIAAARSVGAATAILTRYALDHPKAIGELEVVKNPGSYTAKDIIVTLNDGGKETARKPAAS